MRLNINIAILSRMKTVATILLSKAVSKLFISKDYDVLSTESEDVEMENTLPEFLKM